jgi:hypothetical protein
VAFIRDCAKEGFAEGEIRKLGQLNFLCHVLRCPHGRAGESACGIRQTSRSGV